MLERIEELFQDFRNLGEAGRDLITWLTAFGLVILIYLNIRFLYRILNGFRIYIWNQCFGNCFCSCLGRDLDLKKQYAGEWAIITGATDGIGLQLAHELVKRGMSLILIARNEEKLQKCRNELEAQRLDLNKQQVVTIRKDFADSSLASYEQLERELQLSERKIAILINNVGIFSLKFRLFAEDSSEYLKETLDVNCLSLILMTRMILPQMVAKKRGLIVNVSSVLAEYVAPHFGIYTSSKHFMSSFSRQLQFEYRKLNQLKIINLTCGPVVTKPYAGSPYDSRHNKLFVYPCDYARSVVNILARRTNPPLEFCGHIKHSLLLHYQLLLDRFGLLSRINELLFLKPPTNNQHNPDDNDDGQPQPIEVVRS